jgi:hypothetical protein
MGNVDILIISISIITIFNTTWRTFTKYCNEPRGRGWADLF